MIIIRWLYFRPTHNPWTWAICQTFLTCPWRSNNGHLFHVATYLYTHASFPFVSNFSKLPASRTARSSARKYASQPEFSSPRPGLVIGPFVCVLQHLSLWAAEAAGGEWKIRKWETSTSGPALGSLRTQNTTMKMPHRACSKHMARTATENAAFEMFSKALSAEIQLFGSHCS